jgi:hypothetical protein
MLNLEPLPGVPLIHREDTAMPKFFISFRNGGQTIQDEVGQDFPSLDDARDLALASARELVADNIKSNSPHPVEAVIITDENGKELMTIPAREVLTQPLK